MWIRTVIVLIHGAQFYVTQEGLVVYMGRLPHPADAPIEQRRNVQCLYLAYPSCVSIWVSDCCITPCNQLFRYIMAITSCLRKVCVRESVIYRLFPLFWIGKIHNISNLSYFILWISKSRASIDDVRGTISFCQQINIFRIIYNCAPFRNHWTIK
jgi:hypothetical protein